MTWPPPGRRLLPREAAAILYEAGWKEPFNLTTMVAVAQQEAQFYCEAEGPLNENDTVDWGWLQINSGHARAFGFTDPQVFKIACFNPVMCAKFARQLWNDRVEAGRIGFGPWVAFSSGDYKKFLGTAVIGVANMTASALYLSPIPYVVRA